MPGNKDQGGLFSESDITIDDFKSIVNDIVGGRNLSLFMNLSSSKLSSQIKEAWKVKDEWSYVHLLNLEGKDFEYIWKNKFEKNTRKKIRKALKNNIKIRKADSLEDFKTFYNIYVRASQKWGYKTPPVPFKLLKNLYKYAPSHTKLSLATKDDKIIAGCLSFPYSKTIYCYMSAFLPEYGTFNPNRLLHSELIEYACQEGYKYVNFAASGNLKHIRRVKEEFGPEKVEINRYVIYSNLSKILNKINKLRS
jgi:lipid II:glycine glycyltransferase (peptidoglycan interpeptide bridge formation enzyme)